MIGTCEWENGGSLEVETWEEGGIVAKRVTIRRDWLRTRKDNKQHRRGKKINIQKSHMLIVVLHAIFDM